VRGITLAFILLSATLAAPSGVRNDPLRPGKNQQLNLGKHAAVYLRTHFKVLPSSDPRVQELRDVGSRLLSNVDLKGDPWEFSFDVIDDPKVVNAFSIPGGPVFFYTGLLNRIKTEDELAGVLGHEMTHVIRQHWAYAYADSEKRNLLLNVGLFALHANYTMGDLTSLMNELYDLKFSRKDETQADEGGLQMMANAGYNPQGMVDVFTMLSQLGKGKEPPEWLNDHPDDGHRVKHMQELITAMHQNFPAQRGLPFVASER
jgi:beta-barrel assembly-enhancing protease